ncbi:glycoside hydrolase family 28 protein [Parapedobacter tibetensis]|uniref:glycoside hydrolase family 28 protein n=1 Tax=Parapedobacter tibetensis TaxID=2972951 RepID=UPI00214D7120|nr:glycoside hydrolase family 28 protein [Parapedobacter tibetensis]
MRLSFFKQLPVLSLLLVFLSTACHDAKHQDIADYTPWHSVDEPLAELERVRQQISAPTFPDRDFVITDFGAVGDGTTLNTEAFKKAIETCHTSGGGRVVVPFGTFLTGAIYLKSNVNLHLADSTTILFSRDSTQYPMVFTRWEGMELINYSALIYAYGEENIAITGIGTLDGNADNNHWWWWNGAERFGGRKHIGYQKVARDSLHVLNDQQTDPKTRVFGDGYYLRPNFIQPYLCKNVRIADVKVINSPMWNINPVLCENVIVEHVKVISHGPNNDGCNPESSKNVLISHCYFDTGDDCIAIKSGRDGDGRRIGIPSENIIIEHCYMKDGHGGVVIGSEVSGGARNIFALNNTMDSPQLDRVLRLKTSSSRGGIIEHIFMKDTKVGTYKEAAVRFNMFYEKPGDFLPTIRNIWVENMEVERGGKYGILINAYEESPVQDFRMVNSTMHGVRTPIKANNVRNMTMENVDMDEKSLEKTEEFK